MSARGGWTAVAVTTKKRARELPDTKTLAESGVTDFDATTPLYLMAPAGTPVEIVSKLNEAVAGSIAEPTLANREAELGADVEALSVEGVTDMLRKEDAADPGVREGGRAENGSSGLWSAHRRGEVAAEFLREIDRDAGMDTALAVEQLDGVVERDDRPVPDIGMDVEPAGPVADEGDEVLGLHVVARRRQRHGEALALGPARKAGRRRDDSWARQISACWRGLVGPVFAASSGHLLQANR